jgi:DNA mismatch repair protein MutS
MDAKFIFATHLHDLISIERIKILENLNFFHLSVESNNNELIFNRKLVKGTGEQIYGITIAKFILDDPLFIKESIEIKNELLEKKNINTKLINDKKSLYNKEIYMDNCFLCKSENKLESHHITFQKNFKNEINGLINSEKKHILKNSSANLIVLCNDCHNSIHKKIIKIDSIVKSTEGIKILTD